jgi:putative hemolysin
MLGELSLLALLLVLSAFFSSSETAFTSLDRVRVEHFQRARVRGASRVSAMLARPGRMLSAILLGNNLVNTGSAAVGTLIATQLVGEEGQAVLLATLAVTVLLMVFGEIGPKTVALHHDWALARAYALPLTLWSRLTLPAVAAFDLLGRGLMRIVGGGEAAQHLSVGTLRTAITMGAEAGTLAETQTGMLLGALRLEERPVEQIMVHRTQIISIPAIATLADAAALLGEHGIQRLPVWGSDPDDILGIVRVGDVASALARGEADRPVRDVMREVTFDSELAPIAGVFERMRASGSHLVVLTDEFGSISGIVTLEDVVEEVVGQIRSESGGEPETPAETIEGPNVIEGRTPLADLADELGIELSHPGVQTVAGLVLARLGRLPRPGERVEVDGLEITIHEVDARRIRSVSVRRIEPRAGAPMSGES